MTDYNLTDFLENFEKYEDEECDFFPFLEDEFKAWLVNERKLSEKYVAEYIRNIEHAYYSLYDIVQINLVKTLRSWIVDIPVNPGNSFSKEAAVELVNIYLETMQEELDWNEDAYTKAEKRALAAYHDFIIFYTGGSDSNLLKGKTPSLPDEDEFASWMEHEYKRDPFEVGKIVSSVARMGMILPSLVTAPMSFIDVLRALPTKSKRENYLRKVAGITDKKSNDIAGCSQKTVRNGISNVRYYINFLNQMGK
ncbi:MAG: hypothetical protein NC328_07925 [Muribaculum sp.]|nr:hypothetical protein [Muribaculum sp.]